MLEDFLFFVGAAKNMAEVGRGRDFIPDRNDDSRSRGANGCSQIVSGGVGIRAG